MTYYQDPEEERRRRMQKAEEQQKVAQSQASATPIQATQTPLSGGGGGGGQQGMLQQFGMAAGKKLLGSALGAMGGPMGALFGGLFNNGGKIDYAKEAQKRVAMQNAALRAGAKGQANAPMNRALFTEGGTPLGSVGGDVIKGYAGRAKQGQTQGLQDPNAALKASVQAQKAGGQVNYNQLAAQQAKVQQANAQKEAAARAAYLKKNPQFRVPGASQGVQLKKRNMGGPISGNPYGYNEGGNVGGMPIKKAMDMDKLKAQKSMESLKEQQAERSFQMAERRKDEAHEQSMQQKEESHQQAMKLKKESATMKGPLSGGA